MDTIFMNSENSETSEQYVLIHKLTDKLDLIRSGSAQVQILLAACRRFKMVRISDNGPGWKQG